MTSLLARPPEEAVRILALTQLAKAEEAAKRLSDPQDGEALHDFRVSLRRLRSVVEAYPHALGGALRKSHRKRLRALAHVTGSGRDAEVALGWIEGQRPRLAEGGGSGVDWLSGRLSDRKAAGYEQVHRQLEDDFVPLAGELQRLLGVYTREIRIDEGGGESFGALAAASLREESTQLEELLIGIVSADDADRCHRTRLAVKRVRYLIEPLEREVPAASDSVESLKRLQDLLGEINDSHVLESRLAKAVERAARQRSRSLFAVAIGRSSEPAGEEAGSWGPVDGLLAVARLNRQRREELFAELAAGWTGPSAEEPARGALRRALVHRLGELAGSLAPRQEEAGDRAPVPEIADSEVAASEVAASPGLEDRRPPVEEPAQDAGDEDEGDWGPS